MRCGQLLQAPCRHDSLWLGQKRMSGRSVLPGITPSTIMCPDSAPRTEIRLGVFAHDFPNLVPIALPGIHAPPAPHPLTRGSLNR
jgi:hypothetical protein